MVIYAVIASILFIITFFTTRERVEPPVTQKKVSPIQDLKDLFLCRPWLVLFLLALVFMVTLTLRGASAAYYFKYYLGRIDILGAYIGLQYLGLMIGALLAGYLTKFIDKKKLMMVTLVMVGGLCSAFTLIPEPDQSGTVLIDENTPRNILAKDLLKADVKGSAVDCYSNEKRFWIIRERVKLDERSYILDTSKYAGKTLSVKSIQSDGTVMDSGKTPPEIILIFVLNFLISIALGFKPPITWGMYADVADFNEWRFGRRATAMTFSATTFSQKLGSTVGSAAILATLAVMGYEANTIQGNGSVQAIVYMQSIIPGLLALLAAATLIFYNLDQSKLDKIQLDLAAGRNASQ